MDTQPRQGDKEWRAKKLFPLHLSALKLERNIQDMLQCQCRPANQSSATHQMLETRVKYDLKKNQLFSFLPSALHLSNVVCAETYSTAWDSAVRWWTRTHTHTHTHTHMHIQRARWIFWQILPCLRPRRSGRRWLSSRKCRAEARRQPHRRSWQRCPLRLSRFSAGWCGAGLEATEDREGRRKRGRKIRYMSKERTGWEVGEIGVREQGGRSGRETIKKSYSWEVKWRLYHRV